MKLFHPSVYLIDEKKKQKPEYFRTWLIRILINECRQILAHYRKIEFSGTEREIAALLGINENTVKTRLTRAREQIRVFYSEAISKKGGQA